MWNIPVGRDMCRLYQRVLEAVKITYLDEAKKFECCASKVLRIETWRKCCTSKHDEPSRKCLTMVLCILCQPCTDIFSRNELGQNPHSPKRRPFHFFANTVNYGRPLCQLIPRSDFLLSFTWFIHLLCALHGSLGVVQTTYECVPDDQHVIEVSFQCCLISWEKLWLLHLPWNEFSKWHKSLQDNQVFFNIFDL